MIENSTREAMGKASWKPPAAVDRSRGGDALGRAMQGVKSRRRNIVLTNDCKGLGKRNSSFELCSNNRNLWGSRCG